MSSPAIDLSDVGPLSDALTADYLEYYGVLPVEVMESRLRVATWRDPVDPQAVDDLSVYFAAEVELVPMPEQVVRTAIQRAYGEDAVTAQEVIARMEPDTSLTTADHVPLDDLLSLVNEAPVVKLVNLLLLEALEARASDVHLEGYADTLRVRYRIDGVLQDAPSPPTHLMPAVISRLKIMADLDIAERRVPQDGRIRLTLQNRRVDVRVATLPTLHGESIVLRLLDKEHGRVALEDLGMAPETLAMFRDAIAQPHGIVLATGPTGSGKTTTLYAAVDKIRTGREKILTVEDPVEYELPGVPQVPVREKVGVTFASALRALLRQDPDVLLVGEIRDEETADIATHAALTGHLVLSTLHTNDAPTALTRLLDLGVAPYLVTSTVEAVLAQRLVRKVCESCGERITVLSDAAGSLGLTLDDLADASAGRGCGSCGDTGYRGRTGIYELLILDDDLGAEVTRQAGVAAIRRLAEEKSMRTLRADGLRQIRAGVTTPEEVLRVTRL
jgi:type II secretion system protein E